MTSLFKEKKSLEILEEKEMKIFGSRKWDEKVSYVKLGSEISGQCYKHVRVRNYTRE